jgi:hypothetical protein
VADALVAEARIQLNPWTSYAVEARAEVLARASEVRAPAGDLLADPRTAWWWAPIDRRQIAVGGPADPDHVPTIASSAWAGYGRARTPGW